MLRKPNQVGWCFLGHSFFLTKILINPDHTCSLYLPNEIQQTSSFPLLILQAIMIFCGGFGCSFADYVPTVRPTACLAAGFRKKCCAGRLGDPASMFLSWCVWWPRRALSLSLWPHCVVEGNNKAATTEALPEARRHWTHKFLPCLSGSWLGTGMLVMARRPYPERGCDSQKKAALTSLLIVSAQIF